MCPVALSWFTVLNAIFNMTHLGIAASKMALMVQTGISDYGTDMGEYLL